MIESEAVVERIDGDHVWVRACGPGPACGACPSKGACGAAESAGRAGHLLRLPNTVRALPGDTVVLRVADGVVLRAAWRAYGLPLTLALIGTLAATTWSGSETVALAGLVAGLVAGFLIMRRRGLDCVATEPMLSLTIKHPPHNFS